MLVPHIISTADRFRTSSKLLLDLSKSREEKHKIVVESNLDGSTRLLFPIVRHNKHLGDYLASNKNNVTK